MVSFLPMVRFGPITALAVQKHIQASMAQEHYLSDIYFETTHIILNDFKNTDV